MLGGLEEKISNNFPMKKDKSKYTIEEKLRIIKRYEKVPSAWKFFPELFDPSPEVIERKEIRKNFKILE